ncbi:MAG: DUF3108 domain-containing protein [bacterium]
MRVAAVAIALACTALGAQPGDPHPFAVGEKLSYNAHAGPGINGHAEMWIDGPFEMQGVSAILLHSSFSAKVGFLSVTDNTTSWVDPMRMATLRYVKEERHLLARHNEDVSLSNASRQWTAADGRSGTSPSDDPLDELSFIYALRGFALPEDSMVVLNRHFDAERNPTTLRLVGRGVVTTPAGTFDTREIEMRVRDSRRYRGEGLLRISLSDDPCRRPVRIESSIPGAGTVVMTLTSAVPAIAACAPRVDAPSR